MPNVLVYAQVEDGRIHDVSLQCLRAARAVAGDGGQVTAAVLGSGVGEPAATVFDYGADAVVVLDDATLAAYLARPYAKALAAAVAAKSPDVVLLPATTSGDEMAPLLAVQTDAACVMGCSELALEGGHVMCRRREFDRKVMTTYAATPGRMLVAVLTDGAAEAATADVGRSGTPESLPVPDLATAASVRNRAVSARSVNLKGARVIVGAGAGIGSAENFENIRALAGALDAEIGATRAVVDAGWLSADHQIGQTGATVQPDLYIACGISGAVQHRVGMADSRTIVAINTDKSAPIFRIAHYRIVGDCNAVIPRLLALMEN